MFKPTSILLSFLFLVGLLFASNIHIKSDKLKILKNKIIYIGHVVATTEDNRTLTCDVLEVFLSQNGTIEKVRATGHVLYKDENYRAVGDISLYLPLKGLLILEGNAVFVGKTGIIKGKKIIYHLKTGDIEVKSPSKVEAVMKINKVNEK